MFKAPLFSISPLIKSYYLEQIGYKDTSFKINRSMKKSIKRLSKSIKEPLKWVFIEYNGKQHPILLKKSVGCELILLGPEYLRLKKAKIEKDLEYWKRKLLDILKEDELGKSLVNILFPGIMIKSIPVNVQDMLIKAKAYPIGTIREWSGKKFKKLSNDKWMRVYEGSGGRGEKQAAGNVLKKIQNASSMEELAVIVRSNKERFQDSDGKPLPIVKTFLEESNKSKTELRAKESGVDLKDINPDSKQYYDTVVNWVQAPLTKTRDMRYTAMIKDGSMNGKQTYSEEVDSIDKNVVPIKEKYLYRGTTNESWLKSKEGDEITMGIASFSKSEEIASEFTGDSRIILRYTTPPTGNGIDIHSMVEDVSLGSEWESRGAYLNNYKKEEEVLVRSKSLKVGKIENKKLSDGVEYTLINVSVVPSGMSKSIDEEINKELSDDFNNKLSNRKSEKNTDLEYWKKKLTEIYNKSEDLGKSLEDILYPGTLIKSLPWSTQDDLIKARGFSVGTIRKWGGKEYKKVSPSKWSRTYSETDSRGAKQAIRNVRNKIANAKSMDELVNIIKENKSRFQDKDGKILPIVKEFLTVARGTKAGSKEFPVVEIRKEQAESISDKYNISDKLYKLKKEDLKDLSPYDFGNGSSIYIMDKTGEPKYAIELRKEKYDSYNMESQVIDENTFKPLTTLGSRKGFLPYYIDDFLRKKEEIKIEKKGMSVNGTFQMDEESAMDIVDGLNKKNIDSVEFSYIEEDGDVTFYAEIDKGDFVDNIEINPFDEKDIEDKTGRGKDKKQRKERSDKGFEKNKKMEEVQEKDDYEKKEKEIDDKYKNIKPGEIPLKGEEAQIAIEEANPENRQIKTLEVAGTLEEFKPEDRVLEDQGVKDQKPKNFTMDKTLYTLNDGPMSGQISGKDYTEVDHREVLLVSYKSIKSAGDDWKSAKPEWMPEIDQAQFSRNGNNIMFDKLEDGKYLVPIDQKYKPHGTKRKMSYGNGPWIEEIADNFKKEYAIMTLGQIATSQDFYRKVSKSYNERAYDEKVIRMRDRGYEGKVKKSRIKILPQNRMTYDQQYIYAENRNLSISYFGSKDLWKVHNENQSALKQKTIDMDLMKEEVDNAFSKGNETSYGDSNTSDVLQGEYGVKIKRQDGLEITSEDQNYLAESMSLIQKTFGSRKSMNEKFGLKLSFAKGTAMHARKAVGIFMPSQNAIGISDGKGLKKKNPLTGETMTVDYGDENFGGFVLSHEYAHMMDYYVGKQTGQWYASDYESSTANQIASLFRENMNKESKSDYINRTCECFARALEQYHAIETAGDSAKSFFGKYVDESQYVNKEVYENKIKPLVEKFFQENDKLLKSIDVIW